MSKKISLNENTRNTVSKKKLIVSWDSYPFILGLLKKKKEFRKYPDDRHFLTPPSADTILLQALFDGSERSNSSLLNYFVRRPPVTAGCALIGYHEK